MLDWPEHAEKLRARLVRALYVCGARALAPGVYRVPSDPAALERLGPLLEEVRTAGGRALFARVHEEAS
jgi:hypothetical protein